MRLGNRIRGFLRGSRRAGLAGLLLWGAVVGSVQGAWATTIVDVLPEFNLLPPPPGAFTVGTFSYTIPLGEVLLSASVAGSFGNSQSTSSGATPVIVDGIQVAFCDDGTFGPNGGCQGFSWSFTFGSGDLALFADGSALVTGNWTGPGGIRLGFMTLTLTTGPVPEPSTAALLTLGLMGLAVGGRRSQERSS